MPSKQEIPLKDFIIGRWIGSEQKLYINLVGKPIQVKVEFLDSENIIYSIRNLITEGKGIYNAEGTYKIVDNTLYISATEHGRFIQHAWNIMREGENLVINFEDKLSNEKIVFNRIIIVNWPVFTLALLVLLIGIIFSLLSQSRLFLKGKTSNARIGISNEKKNTNILLKLGYWLLAVLSFFMGICVGMISGDWLLFLLIREPWYSIVILESGLILLLLGIKSISLKPIPSYELTKLSKFSKQYHLLGGLVLFGISCLWILFGMTSILSRMD